MASQPLTHTGRGCAAVTPHHLATTAAVDAMSSGGNAVDGAIAANAVLGMVQPTSCGIGGDLFALIHSPGESAPRVLNASGRAGSGADAALLRDSGQTHIDLRSPSSVTVPGCVDGWRALAELATRPLADLIAPAITLGKEGFAVSEELASDLARIAGFVAHQPGAAHLYPDDAPPDAGSTLRRPDLASTLEAIAADGRAAFYEGLVASEVSAATTGLITPDDLAANRPDWVTPIGATVFGLDAWTVPPNSQGYLTIAAALLIEALGPPPDPTSPEFHHAVIEAYRAVAWERDDLVADPDHAPMPNPELLDPGRVLDRLGAISDRTVAAWPGSRSLGTDTAYFCTVDGDGMAVSIIQSNYTGIGSGIATDTSGVFLHNRGAGFTLQPGHPNLLAPGKRPLHTLSPTLWTRDGQPALVLGTRGGHQQPQYLAQIATLLLHVGLTPGEAQAAPRWHIDEVDPAGSAIAVEADMPDAVSSGLADRGHAVEQRPARQVGWGPVSIIAIDEAGVHHAAADPRVSTASAQGD